MFNPYPKVRDLTRDELLFARQFKLFIVSDYILRKILYVLMLSPSIPIVCIYILGIGFGYVVGAYVPILIYLIVYSKYRRGLRYCIYFRFEELRKNFSIANKIANKIHKEYPNEFMHLSLSDIY